MYWPVVQGLRVKAFVVCCVLFVVCCLLFVVPYCVFVHEVERQVETNVGVCLFVGVFVCAEIKIQQQFGDITGNMGKSS